MRKKIQHCVSKYHSAGLVNSRVYPLQTDPDKRQTGIKQEALALYNQTSHWCHIQELWQCWYSIYIRTVCSLFALSCNSHPLSYHQLIGSRHMAQLVPHNAHSIAKHKIKQHIFIYIFLEAIWLISTVRKILYISLSLPYLPTIPSYFT